jgi:hypothetical protein
MAADKLTIKIESAPFILSGLLSLVNLSEQQISSLIARGSLSHELPIGWDLSDSKPKLI